MIALVDLLPNDAAETAAIVAQHGWPQRSYASLAAAVATANDDDILLCAAGDGASMSASPAIRATAAPMIALASAEWIAATDWRGCGFVAAVDRRRLAVDLPVVVTEWSHATRLATLDRLAEAFGVEPVARLLHGFRLALEAALMARDAAPLDVAHRIAGLAGTLGFAALGRHWLHIAEGGGPVSAATRRATAHALATLDRTALLTPPGSDRAPRRDGY